MQFSFGRLKTAFFFPVVFFISGPMFAQQTATDFFKISSRSFDYKDYDNAIFFANKALELNPKYGAAYWNLAMAYDSKGMYHKSSSNYSAAIKLYDNDKDQAALHKNRGMVYNELKNYDSAIYDFDIAIEMNLDYGNAYWNRGLAYDGLKKYKPAINDYTKAVQFMEPGEDMAQVYLQRGVDYALLNQKEKSDSDYHKVLKIMPEPGYYSAYAWLLLGSKNEALEQVNKFLAKAETKPDDLKYGYLNAASIYAMLNNETESLKYLDLAFKTGYSDFLYLQKDKDFDNIRDGEAYKALIKKHTPH
jgi:hypothetical protein